MPSSWPAHLLSARLPPPLRGCVTRLARAARSRSATRAWSGGRSASPRSRRSRSGAVSATGSSGRDPSLAPGSGSASLTPQRYWRKTPSGSAPSVPPWWSVSASACHQALRSACRRHRAPRLSGTLLPMMSRSPFGHGRSHCFALPGSAACHSLRSPLEHSMIAHSGSRSWAPVAQTARCLPWPQAWNKMVAPSDRDLSSRGERVLRNREQHPASGPKCVPGNSDRPESPSRREHSAESGACHAGVHRSRWRLSLT